MTIFLVVPASAPTHKTSLYKKFIYPSGPIGIAYLAAVARDQGHEVIVIDQYATGIGEEDLVEIAVNRKVDLFGLSCLTPNMPRVESVVKQMREALPDVHIVLGNTHAVYFAEEIFRDLPIDSIVLGEGEQTFVELLQRLETGQPIEGMPIAYGIRRSLFVRSLRRIDQRRTCRVLRRGNAANCLLPARD